MVLDNGVVVVSQHYPHACGVSIGVWVRVGSCHEPLKQGGISHFIEHMVFKGTEKRSALDLVTELESVGGELNAFTDKEWTCYHALVLRENLPLAVDILSDLVINPTFPRVEVEREKKVLLQEMAMVEEAPDEWVTDELLKSVWKGEPLGPSVIGTKKSVKGTSRADLLKFFRQHYRPENIVVSVAGNFDFNQLKESCEKYFVFPSKQKTIPLAAPTSVYKPKRKHIGAKTEQTHLLIAFEGLGFRSEDRFAVLLLSYYLGGGMSSRLFQEVREKAGLAYAVDCDPLPFTDTGLFCVYAGLTAKTLSKCLGIVGRELQTTVDKGVPEKDLERIKNQVCGGLLLGSEDMESRQESLGRNEIVFGNHIPISETAAAIRNVDPGLVHEVAKRIIRPERESVFTLGPSVPKKKRLSLFQ